MAVPQRIYQSPPGSGGNDGALPKTYDQTWSTYTNLTPQQIAAFQSFPQDLLNYSMQRRWLAEISGVNVTIGTATFPVDTSDRSKYMIRHMRTSVDDSVSATVQYKDANGTFHVIGLPQVKSLDDAVSHFTQQLFNAENSNATAINNGTMTLRSQVDAVYAAIAPNSPSATNPGTP